MEEVVQYILQFTGIYLALGALFSLVFYFKGLKHIDAIGHNGSLFFKLLILPGLVMLWPIFLIKWISAR